eukprot:161810-Rhodomonas_salina.1
MSGTVCGTNRYCVVLYAVLSDTGRYCAILKWRMVTWVTWQPTNVARAQEEAVQRQEEARLRSKP